MIRFKEHLAMGLIVGSAGLLASCGADDSNQVTQNQSLEPTITEIEPTEEVESENDIPEFEPSETASPDLDPRDEFPGLLMGEAGPDLETSWLNEIEISGDLQEDLRDVGFDPPAEDFDEMMEYFDEWFCAPSLADPSNRLSYLGDVRMALRNDDVDMMRIFVRHSCPGRAETVDRLFIYVEANE